MQEESHVFYTNKHNGNIRYSLDSDPISSFIFKEYHILDA